MIKHLVIVILILFTMQMSFASNTFVFHNELEPVPIGEKAQFEYSLIGLDADIYEARLFYRLKGDADFKSQIMYEQGFLLSTQLDTKDLNAGTVEYYLAMQTITGEVLTYPEINPSQNPSSFKLVASAGSMVFQNIENVLLLSPDMNDVIPEDELIIAFSIPNEAANIDHNKTRLLIDGINVSNLMERDENVYLFSPSSMRTGPHNVEFKIFSPDGSLLAKEEFSFRISSSSSSSSQFRQVTNIFLENRFQNVSETSDNFARAGFTWNSDYNGWNFKLKGISNTDDGFSGQSPNRFGAFVAYNFNPQTNIYLKGGDFSGDYDQLSFWNRRIFGLGFGFNSNWFDLDISIGQSANKVKGVLDFTLSSDTVATINNFSTGKFDESFLAIRPVFHFGNHVDWGLDLINSREDPKSISTESVTLKINESGTLRNYKLGANPKESLVLGTTLGMNFDNSRVRFSGSFQASIINNDASNEIDFDTLADSLELSDSERSVAETFIGIVDPFLTISDGLVLTPGLAMQFDTYLNYFNNYLKITYKNIESNYRTAGNPYLLKGLRGVFINDNIRLLENQLFLNLYFNSYEDNLSQKGAEIANSDLGLSLSYFPNIDYPGVTVSYGNQSRSNEYDLDSKEFYQPDSMSFYPEDNSSQRVSVSSNYTFATGSVKNTATISVSNIIRDDKIVTRFYDDSGIPINTFTNNSDFTIFSLAFRNNFSMPLITRLGFSQSSSLLGKDGDNELENIILRYYGGAEYKIDKLTKDFDLKPFVNFSFSQIDNSTSEYNRINYTAGLYLNSSLYGNLSFRTDFIDFGDLKDYSDMILSARYDVTF